MSLEESFNKLEALSAELEEQKRLINEQFKERLRPIFNEFLDSHPELKSFAWTQYTPYFNDGEPCTFSVNDIYSEDVELTDENDRYVEYIWSGSSEGQRSLYVKYTSLREDLKRLERILMHNEDILQSVFGDHAKITVTRNSVEVDEYEHE